MFSLLLAAALVQTLDAAAHDLRFRGIARLEKGDPQRIPTFETIFRLLKVLGYSVSVHVQRTKRASAA